MKESSKPSSGFCANVSCDFEDESICGWTQMDRMAGKQLNQVVVVVPEVYAVSQDNTVLIKPAGRQYLYHFSTPI